jgi:Fe2+ or Zn2+ uptake regulation protein
MIPDKVDREAHRQTVETMLSHLRRKGYKLTPQRRAVVTVLAQDRSHPHVSEIIARARSLSPRISASTVYYTLAMLKEENLIREIEFYNADNRYDTNVSDHLNLICMACGKIEDYEGTVPVSARTVAETTGFRPVRMRFESYGYCKRCVRKGGK